MLENINLTLDDQQLRNSTNVKFIGKLSWVVYVQPIFNILIGILLINIYAKYEGVASQTIYQFLNQSNLVANITSALNLTKEQMVSNTFLVYRAAETILLFAILFIFFMKSAITIARYSKTTLIVDNMGVWVKSGLFAFTRETCGVVWNNADLARTENGFINHIFKVYPITMMNRFSGVVELKVPALKNGREALKLINEEVSNKLMNNQNPQQ